MNSTTQPVRIDVSDWKPRIVPIPWPPREYRGYPKIMGTGGTEPGPQELAMARRIYRELYPE